MTKPGTGLVEWYRPDIRREVWRAWKRAFAIVVVAMLVLGIPMGGYERPTTWRVIAWVIGGLCILIGPTYLIVALLRILRREIFIAVRQDGLWWQPATGPSHEASWQDIDDISLTPGGWLVVTVSDQPLWVFEHSFYGITNAALSERLRHLQRRALMGLRLNSTDL